MDYPELDNNWVKTVVLHKEGKAMRVGIRPLVKPSSLVGPMNASFCLMLKKESKLGVGGQVLPVSFC